MATRYPPSAENIRFLAGKLLEGELVAVPTETVYGLAANALDSSASAKIFQVKERPSFDPLIVHIPDVSALDSIAIPNDAAIALAENFWPGPLTVVLEKKASIPDIVTSGLPSVAVRVSSHPVFQELLNASRIPLAAPSANLFGYVSPSTAEHVEEGLGTRIAHILDGGPCSVGIESTIIDLRTPEQPILLRPGGIPAEAIESALATRLHEQPSPSQTGIMPGQLDRHYSPRSLIRLFPHTEMPDHPPAADTARVYFQRPDETPDSPKNIFWLSETGDAAEAASNLFQMLRQLDKMSFHRAEVELAPPIGLGCAINDRLRRARGVSSLPAE